MKNKQQSIQWDLHGQHPIIQLKDGILRRRYLMHEVETTSQNRVLYRSHELALEGRWELVNKHCSTLSLKLKNTGTSSVRVTRLMFPAENGIENFVSDFPGQDLRFLRNGYQSWSTARSYKPTDKPLRPWLQIVSQVSSNLANLPSNIPGIFSSEMFTVISDSSADEAFLIGQGAPYHQFFYIQFNLHQSEKKESYVELTYDFGRKMIGPGESIQLDTIFMARGKTHQILESYMNWASRNMKIQLPKHPLTGYGTWYYYFEHITPEIILENLKALKNKNIDLDVFQIDDGYQTQVGDWLNPRPEFRGRMKELADTIQEAGYTPGIWIAPFVTNANSRLAKIHPDYILKNEHGRKLIGGYSPTWDGRSYYGLDVTYPRYEEYLRKVIRTIVHDWGFRFLKCDFLFGGCLRGAAHYNIELSRAEVLRRGMQLIREEAGPEVLIEGCGMPLVPGVGLVDLMRIGPDTGPFWIKRTGKFLRTGAMMGVRNAIRNSFVRSMFHRKFWLNDPDCLMLRKENTRLTHAQRQTQINAIILSGGPILLSDNLAHFNDDLWKEFSQIRDMNKRCFEGNLIPCDLMEQEIPELLYNTAGYLGIFNMKKTHRKSQKVKICHLPEKTRQLKNVWNKEIMEINPDGSLELPALAPYSSRLYQIES